VNEGGTLITEGGTSTIFPEYNLTSGITVETPSGLFVRGSILRGIVTDSQSPLAYGYEGRQIPVYFSQSPVLRVGGGGGFAGFGGGGGTRPNLGQGQITTPMANKLRLSPYGTPADTGGRAPAGGQTGGGPGGGAGGGGFGQPQAGERPRVVLSFPTNPDEMLLSGTLAGGQALAGRAQVIDAPLGRGHVVSFAIRPFWRWQTQGTFFLGFNAILNWNDLDAGRPAPATRPVGGQ
jgi:hypothetical protein